MKFIILSSSLKVGGKMRHAGEEIDIPAEEAEKVNLKGSFLEAAEIHAAKTKTKAESEKAIAKAEHDAKTKAESEKAKGGGK